MSEANEASPATKGSEVERAVRHHYCSFCGGRDDEVPLLIGGPAVMICSNCVEKCVKVLAQQNIIFPVAQRQWVEGSDDSNSGWWDFEEIDETTPLHAGAEALYLVPNVQIEGQPVSGLSRSNAGLGGNDE